MQVRSPRAGASGAWLAAAILAVAGCGALGPLAATSAGGTGMLAAAAADLPGVDADIARNTLEITEAGTWVRRLPEIRREKMATLLSYRAMDNDLGPIALRPHLDNLESAGSSAYANLLVFADGPEDGDSRTYYMRHDRGRALISPFVYPGGDDRELNSAHPATLRDFVSSGFSRYPGKFKVLDVASHGAGYQGMCVDYSSNYDQMALEAFGASVKQGLKGRKLDVLNLLACLMGAIEVAYEFRDVASVLVASEDNLMGDDVDLVMDYDVTFGQIASRTGHLPASAQELGKALVHEAHPERARSGAFTLAAIDMDRVADVKRQINVLSKALLAAMPARRAGILAAWQQTPYMYRDSRGNSSHRDIVAFCKRLKASVADPAVQEAAQDLSRSIKEDLVLSYRRKAPEKDLAHGLSIYMPAPDEAFDDAYMKTRFARDTLWPRVIQAIQTGR